MTCSHKTWAKGNKIFWFADLKNAGIKSITQVIMSSVHTHGIYPYYSGDKGSDSSSGDKRGDKVTVLTAVGLVIYPGVYPHI